MIKKTFFLFVSLVLVFISCDEAYEPSLDNGLFKYGVVLKERDSNSPLILTNRTKGLLHKEVISRTVVEFDDCLGRSFANMTLPFGSIENLKYQVVDVDKLSKDKPTYFTIKRIGGGEANSFSYSSFERYTKNSKTTKKINGGFSVNLGLFSIGAKSKMEEVFSSSIIQEERRVFGELNVVIKESVYTMQTSSNINKKIILDYLTPDFKDELYNSVW